MLLVDFWIVFRWWGTLFLVGAIAFPLTKRLFAHWHDEGYLFAKAIGMATVTYGTYVLSILHVAPFTIQTVIVVLVGLFIVGLVLNTSPRLPKVLKWKTIVIEELFFFLALFFWSWVKGHEASIHGLEKFMDYGFMKSILKTSWFPAPDMWYQGFPINYYYFGHTVVAMLTKLSGIDLSYTFNLMLAAIFALCATMSFSIAMQLIGGLRKISNVGKVGGALLTSFLVTLGGNMQTLYAFTKGYTGEDVKPFWQLLWKPSEFWTRLPEGLERYWYANATRFIPFTIHEFPAYSFVVSDIHGHVLSIPFVLLAIALLIEGFSASVHFLFYGFLCAILLMTNALDGPIYVALFLGLFALKERKRLVHIRRHWKSMVIPLGLTLGATALTSLPFVLHFRSFVSGVAVNCPPSWFADRRVGILLFEGVEKCQHSPLWMMALLWGFFWYCGARLLLWRKKFTQHEIILSVFFLFSVGLWIFPEFFYFKDIYPAHFRSNTMFKLGYDAFILCSIVAGYVIVKAFTEKRTLFLWLVIPQLFLVAIYPMFAVRSYFDSLRQYRTLDGLAWMKEQYPDDYHAILWLNAHAREGDGIVEADGDSYTDYERISAFTGMPTIVGWAVHEWLWRGSYDVVAPRREEVRMLYESADTAVISAIAQKYGVTYIVVGTKEREKYPNLNTNTIATMSDLVYIEGSTMIYRVR